MAERYYRYQIETCADYVPREPSLGDEALVLRRLAARYALLTEGVSDPSLVDEISRYACELEERAGLLERSESSNPCFSCLSRMCFLRRVSLIESLIQELALIRPA
ncbi:MAG TPA: hypothetical protein VNH44_14570 [Micropepsaceae bacterium]|nr:hypothetical protein [Micropepsaceae bacterium]